MIDTKAKTWLVGITAIVAVIGGAVFACHTALRTHDQTIYARAVSDHSEVIQSESCGLGIDPSSGSVTVDGVLVVPDQDVVASRSCSADLVSAWTDRRLSDESDGYCGTNWFRDDSRVSTCLAWRQSLMPRTDGIPWDGIRISTATGGVVTISECTVVDTSDGCEEWSR